MTTIKHQAYTHPNCHMCGKNLKRGTENPTIIRSKGRYRCIWKRVHIIHFFGLLLTTQPAWGGGNLAVKPDLWCLIPQASIRSPGDPAGFNSEVVSLDLTWIEPNRFVTVTFGYSGPPETCMTGGEIPAKGVHRCFYEYLNTGGGEIGNEMERVALQEHVQNWCKDAKLTSSTYLIVKEITDFKTAEPKSVAYLFPRSINSVSKWPRICHTAS